MRSHRWSWFIIVTIRNARELGGAPPGEFHNCQRRSVTSACENKSNWVREPFRGQWNFALTILRVACVNQIHIGVSLERDRLFRWNWVKYIHINKFLYDTTEIKEIYYKTDFSWWILESVAVRFRWYIKFKICSNTSYCIVIIISIGNGEKQISTIH